MVHVTLGWADLQKTVFAEKMASAMEDVTFPFLGADFNTWFPLTVVMYCLLL